MDASENFYGVVLGPSGTGEIVVTRKVCNQHPKGVLYYEVCSHGAIVMGMAISAGLRMLPDTGNVFDLVLVYISDNYCQYHTLPKETQEGIDYVLNKVVMQAVRFKKNHGYIPHFVIN